MLAGVAALLIPHATIDGLARPAQTALAGEWTGEIRVADITLQMRVMIAVAADGPSVTIDLPQRGASGLAARAVRIDGARVRFELGATPPAVFDGTRDGDRIEGAFTQGGVSGTFVLARGGRLAAAAPLPEQADAPYDVEDVAFGHGDVRLAGTLTTPRGAGPFPAAILLSGSGPHTRDGEVDGFRMAAVLADALTSADIAVLRFDDRGVGRSSGPADLTTDASMDDALAAVALVRARAGGDRRIGRIGFVGHSEGAIVAAGAAARSADVGFVILLAGPMVTGERILRAQAAAIARARGAGDAEIEAIGRRQDELFRAVRTGEGWTEIERVARDEHRARLARLPEAERRAIGDEERYLDGIVAQQLAGVRSPWYRHFIDHDPAPAIAALAVPVLAVFGEQDLQVPIDLARPAFEAIVARAGLTRATVRAYAGANHLFQPAVTGAPSEYASLPKTFVPGFTADLAAWIRRWASGPAFEHRRNRHSRIEN